MAAIPLAVDALYDALDELAPMLLRREVAGGEIGEAQHDGGTVPAEVSAALRRQRRVERERAH